MSSLLKSAKIKIKDIGAIENGRNISFHGLVVSSQRLPKKNGGEYLAVKLQDNTGAIESPIWEDLPFWEQRTPPGAKLLVTGIKSDFAGTPQIKFVLVTELPADQAPTSDFIPSYDIPDAALTYFAEFIAKIQDQRYHLILNNLLGITVKKDRSGTPELAVFKHKKWVKFISAPSASTHHGNKVGGLFMHVIGVAKAIDNMLLNYAEQPFFLKAEQSKLDADVLRFLAIVHDYDKTKEYLWEEGVKYNENAHVGHEILFMETFGAANEACGQIFNLEERTAMYSIILMHHGQWGKYQPSPKDKVFLEAKLLHCADMIDSQIVGAIERA